MTWRCCLRQDSGTETGYDTTHSKCVRLSSVLSSILIVDSSAFQRDAVSRCAFSFLPSWRNVKYDINDSFELGKTKIIKKPSIYSRKRASYRSVDHAVNSPVCSLNMLANESSMDGKPSKRRRFQTTLLKPREEMKIEQFFGDFLVCLSAFFSSQATTNFSELSDRLRTMPK